MGVVNVTPDSFSDGGVNLDPDDAVASARRMLDEGAAIVDVGGESTRPGAEGVSADEELRRVVPVLEQLARGAVLDRHLEGRGRAPGARARRRARQRRHRAARRPGAGRGRRRVGRVPLPDAHAGRAADDAGRPALRRRRLGGRRVPRGAAALRRSLPGSPRSASASIPESASARRSSRTSSSSRRLDELTALGRPVVIGFSRKSSLGSCSATRRRRPARVAASVGAAVAAYERGATILRVHDVREHVEALAAAQAALA